MRRRPIVTTLALVMTAVAGLLVTARALGLGPGGNCTRPLRFGFVVQTDRPFYRPGATAHVLLAHFNFSAEDAFGYARQGGGNGCNFRVEVRDASGNVVWEPGFLDAAGNHTPPGCTDAIVDRPLPSGSFLRDRGAIPLVYQNGRGNGRNGDPLPPGVYRVCVFAEFNGPDRAAGAFDAGLDPEACIPIRIE
jgi:hypothetical protein